MFFEKKITFFCYYLNVGIGKRTNPFFIGLLLQIQLWVNLTLRFIVVLGYFFYKTYSKCPKFRPVLNIDHLNFEILKLNFKDDCLY